MEEKLSELTNLITELVEVSGSKVLIHTQVCVEHKLTHNNCAGCTSELSCSKLVRIHLLNLKSMLYPPRNFEESLKQDSLLSNLTDKILSCKTPDELKRLSV